MENGECYGHGTGVDFVGLVSSQSSREVSQRQANHQLHRTLQTTFFSTYYPGYWETPFEFHTPPMEDLRNISKTERERERESE